LGDKIRQYRFQSGISQEKLAKMVGVNESTIFHWEKGQSKPFSKSLKKLEGVLCGR